MRLSWLAMLLLLAPLDAQGADPAYKVVAIPMLPGATFGEATAVNNKGEVVGRCLIGGVYHGFLYDASSGNLTNLGALGPEDTHGLWGINDDRAIVGTAAGSEGQGSRAILISQTLTRSDITQQTTVFSAMAGAEARAINSIGRVAGVSSFDCSLTQSSLLGCRWSPGGFFCTAMLGSNNECSATAAMAINDLDRLAGWAELNVGSVLEPFLIPRPYLAEDDGQTALPTFSSIFEFGMALGIGNQGDACGIVQDLSDSGRVHPVLWSGGSIVKLQSLGGGYAEGSVALGVNSAADVVGRSGNEATGQAVAWLGGNPEPFALSSLGTVSTHSAGYRLTAALAINDGGFIVGRGVGIEPGDTSGQTVPFMLLPCTPVVIQHPAQQSSCLRGTAALTVRAVGAGPLNYQWRKNGEDLADGTQPSGALIVGAQTRSMRVFGFVFGDEGEYDVVITGSCGSTASAKAGVVVCPEDLSCDGVVTDSDFVLFAAAYNILDCADPAMPFGCAADFNHDGMVDDADFVEFIVAYNLLFCF